MPTKRSPKAVTSCWNQFANNDNWKAHYKTTGPEIWNDTNGTVTHFVSAMGTTGTIIGTSTYLKEKNTAIEIIGAQPSDGSQIPGIREMASRIFTKNIRRFKSRYYY